MSVCQDADVIREETPDCDDDDDAVRQPVPDSPAAAAEFDDRDDGQDDDEVMETVGIFRPHLSTTYVDADYCYRQSSVVCLSVTIVSRAKMAETIEMPLDCGVDIWTHGSMY